MTSPYLTSAVVHRLTPSDSASKFSWLSEVVDATDILCLVGSAVASLSSSRQIDHVTIFIHFHSPST
jgi:hypothetical protein